LEARLQAELKKIGDDFRPREYYLDQWGYKVDGGGAIPYGANAKMQTPDPAAFKSHLPRP
jgi:hypothetical protein